MCEFAHKEGMLELGAFEMRSPFNSSQTLAAVGVMAALMAGAFALGRSQPAVDPVPAAESNLEESTKPPAAAPVAEKASEPLLCDECGRVVSVRTVERQGKASGLGAIGGAVVGGLLGHQLGGGTGKKIATVGGAVAGGMAGNEIEKRNKARHVWIVRVTLKDGSTQNYEQGSEPGLHAGDVVLVRDGQVQRR